MERLLVDEISRACGGEIVLGDRADFVTGISTDSRSIQPGEFFVPLSGERFDGHMFVVDALAKGAQGALVERGRWPEIYEKPAQERTAIGSQSRVGLQGEPAVVLVQETLAALHAVARYYRNKFTLPVIAVTGSVGKTTTKDLVASIFSARYETLKSHKNFNNEVGVPLTLFQLEKRHQALVLELGMRGEGQIRQLAQTSRPTTGIITNVGEVHLELLGSIEAVARAKAELVESLAPDAVAVLNADDPRVLAMGKRTPARVMTFGFAAAADVRATDVRWEGNAAVLFELAYGGESRRMRLAMAGRHYVSGALAAAAAAFANGLGWDEVSKGLESVRPSGMRMEISVTDDGITLINDAYNAGPLSVKAALEALSEMAVRGRRIAMLGEMLELGEASRRAHKDVGTEVARLGIDFFIAVGPSAPLMRDAAVGEGLPSENAVCCADNKEAAQVALTTVQPSDTLLVKGSRCVGLEVVIEALLGRRSTT